MFCVRCGNSLQEGQLFCDCCGFKNENVIRENNEVPLASGVSVKTEKSAQSKVKKSKLFFVSVSIILSVSIIAGVIFIAGLFINKNKKTTIWVATEYCYNNYYKLELSYREDGLVSEAYRCFYNDTISEEKMEYIYDKNLNLQEQMFSNSNRSRFFTYDKNGNMLSDIIYYEGKTEDETYYTYDENSLLIEKQELNHKYVYEYDKKGNLISEKETDSDGTVSKTIHKYDKLNRRIETEDSLGKSVYKYDLKNRLIEIIRYTNGSEEGRCVLEYDDNGNLISIKKIVSSEDFYIYGDFSAGDIVNMTTVKYMPIEVDTDMAVLIKEKQGFDWLFNDIYDYYNW